MTMLAMLPAPPPAMAPTAVGRADGWGMDDMGLVFLAVSLVLVAATVVGRFVPQHGGRVARWKIFGRSPNGVVAVTAILNAGMAVFLTLGVARGLLLQGPVGVALGVAAGMSAAALVIGWWVQRLRHWIGTGLMLSLAVWSGICATNIAAGQVVSSWIAFSLSLLYLYTWLAEVTDIGGGKHTGEQ